MLLLLPLSIICEIFNYLDLITQLSIKATCKVLKNELKIIDLYNVKISILRKLDDNILNSENFQYVKFLNLSLNKNITQNGIQNLIMLKKLNIRNNPNIENLSNLTNLEQLDASGNECKLNQDGIKNLKNLIKLDIGNNPNINNLSHLTNLKELDISGKSGVNQNGVEELINLKILIMSYNTNIINLKFITKMSKLEKINYECFFFEEKKIEDLKNLKNIQVLSNLNLNFK